MLVVPLVLRVGTVLGESGATGANHISDSEYRQWFLRPGQSATRMALEFAAVMFA